MSTTSPEEQLSVLREQFVYESGKFLDFLGSQQELILKKGTQTRAELAHYKRIGRTLRFIRGITQEVVDESSKLNLSIVSK